MGASVQPDEAVASGSAGSSFRRGPTRSPSSIAWWSGYRLFEGADCSWIDQLYLLPAWVDRGSGTRLLELAQGDLMPPIRLHTFQCNQRAGCFYERHRFKASP